MIKARLSFVDENGEPVSVARLVAEVYPITVAYADKMFPLIRDIEDRYADTVCPEKELPNYVENEHLVEPMLTTLAGLLIRDCRNMMEVELK